MRGKVLLLGVALFSLTNCDQHPWQAWVYPDAGNERFSNSLAGFETFEQCQEAAIATLRSFREPDRGSYICGRSCRWDPDLRTNRCKELRR
jgi:hypothetical protein